MFEPALDGQKILGRKLELGEQLTNLTCEPLHLTALFRDKVQVLWSLLIEVFAVVS